MATDEELYGRIMAKLKFDPSLDASNITIVTEGDGVITLGGKVKSYSDKHNAEELAKKTIGIQGIANEIEVDPSSAYKRSDAEIAKSAIDSLRWNVLVPAELIKIVVDDGTLTLSGEVEWHYQKEHAEKAVQNLYGVKHVINNIKLKPKITVSEVKQQILKEFERNARIDAENISVLVDGSKVSLEGAVKNFEEYDEAAQAAWSVPGVTTVSNHLKIECSVNEKLIY